ncbi:YqzL family protein [Gorillibacterium sp. sgz5001074]
MRDFTWNYFSMTGDVNAYLLYKEMSPTMVQEDLTEEEPEPEQAESAV